VHPEPRPEQSKGDDEQEHALVNGVLDDKGSLHSGREDQHRDRGYAEDQDALERVDIDQQIDRATTWQTPVWSPVPTVTNFSSAA
jgi:hypothetical protein